MAISRGGDGNLGFAASGGEVRIPTEPGSATCVDAPPDAAPSTTKKNSAVTHVIPGETFKLIEQLLVDTRWPISSRTKVPGRGTCVGVTFSGKQGYIGPLTKSVEQLIRLINNTMFSIAESRGTDYRWSSIQINHNTISAKHTDRNNLGESWSFTAGHFDGGQLIVPYLRFKGAKPGVMVQFDGRRTHWSLPFTGERYSVVVFCHDRHRDVVGKDREYLEGLGFHLQPWWVEARVNLGRGGWRRG